MMLNIGQMLSGLFWLCACADSVYYFSYGTRSCARKYLRNNCLILACLGYFPIDVNKFTRPRPPNMYSYAIAHIYLSVSLSLSYLIDQGKRRKQL